MSVSVNGAQLDEIVYNFDNFDQQLFLILGGNQLFDKCDVNLNFHDINFYNRFEPFDPADLENLSSGYLEPLYLSKFNDEPSYNKLFDNLLDNGIGPIKNGAKLDSFSLFTSVGTAKNNLGRKAHIMNDLSVYLLPQFLLRNTDVNQSYVFLMQFDLFYKNFSESEFENNYYHVLY